MKGGFFMSVGRRMKELRKGSGRTLKEQSELYDVSLNSVYRWEHDLVRPKKSLIKKMADFYNVTYDWLLNGNKPRGSLGFGAGVCFDNSTERQLLRMFRGLPGSSKCRILGYVECICIEEGV
jgi:transcriptional regulator with XRE-family HTH domain